MMSKNIGGRAVKASLDESVITSMKDLEKMLIKIVESSRTSKLWVMCFIGPIFTINTHTITVREGDWALHLAIEEEMHYLHSVEVMPQDVRIEFPTGNHTMHHKRGQVNDIWSDMTIEVTFVRFGHSKGNHWHHH